MKQILSLLLAILAVSPGVSSYGADNASAKTPDYPPHESVFEGYKQVISTIDQSRSLIGLFHDAKDNQLLAAFPKKYDSKKFFIALTVASGEQYAGLQQADMYVYWKQIGKRMVLIQPNIEIRSSGDAESKSSIQRLFTEVMQPGMPFRR
ncbi:MAG: hypothetical protein VW804_15745, partial [Verrucomicrobiota bacterium]